MNSSRSWPRAGLRALTQALIGLRPGVRRLVPRGLHHVTGQAARWLIRSVEATGVRTDEIDAFAPAARPFLNAEAFAAGPILHANTALAWGGAERQLVNILTRLPHRLDRPVGLLCLRLGESPEFDFFLPELAEDRPAASQRHARSRGGGTAPSPGWRVGRVADRRGAGLGPQGLRRRRAALRRRVCGPAPTRGARLAGRRGAGGRLCCPCRRRAAHRRCRAQRAARQFQLLPTLHADRLPAAGRRAPHHPVQQQRGWRARLRGLARHRPGAHRGRAERHRRGSRPPHPGRRGAGFPRPVGRARGRPADRLDLQALPGEATPAMGACRATDRPACARSALCRVRLRLDGGAFHPRGQAARARRPAPADAAHAGAFAGPFRLRCVRPDVAVRGHAQRRARGRAGRRAGRSDGRRRRRRNDRSRGAQATWWPIAPT